MEEQERPLIKVTLVGDHTGKTHLLNAYVFDKLPDYSFSLFEHYKKTIKVDNQEYQLELHDTPGQEDYAKIRPLTYPNTKCFIICFSLSEKSSYKNVLHVWAPELKRHMPDIPIVLVATKVDLRGDPKQETITKAEGKKLQRQIKAESYVECSATKRINLQEVFKEAVRCTARKKTSKDSKSCTLS
ncbi:hypothetical protein ILUMI_01864 [Ignelater luminosus]|uniref:Uncharacterized protein n=1 Tax=Ignelater luminosus TaxID=2038154 RepID=A0A8K0DPX1_IGNLU|nr:hypothetical protein ILUMI_01864 [Ignelater luminosus]